jgi:hypothetical protein
MLSIHNHNEFEEELVTLTICMYLVFFSQGTRDF